MPSEPLPYPSRSTGGSSPGPLPYPSSAILGRASPVPTYSDEGVAVDPSTVTEKLMHPNAIRYCYASEPPPCRPHLQQYRHLSPHYAMEGPPSTITPLSNNTPPAVHTCNDTDARQTVPTFSDGGAAVDPSLVNKFLIHPKAIRYRHS